VVVPEHGVLEPSMCEATSEALFLAARNLTEDRLVEPAVVRISQGGVEIHYFDEAQIFATHIGGVALQQGGGGVFYSNFAALFTDFGGTGVPGYDTVIWATDGSRNRWVTRFDCPARANWEGPIGISPRGTVVAALGMEVPGGGVAGCDLYPCVTVAEMEIATGEVVASSTSTPYDHSTDTHARLPRAMTAVGSESELRVYTGAQLGSGGAPLRPLTTKFVLPSYTPLQMGEVPGEDLYPDLQVSQSGMMIELTVLGVPSRNPTHAAIYDVSGREVWRGTAANGRNPRFQLPTPGAGVYFARAWSSGFAVSRRTVVVR
jgi:hypothetical protein